MVSSASIPRLFRLGQLVAYKSLALLNIYLAMWSTSPHLHFPHYLNIWFSSTHHKSTISKNLGYIFNYISAKICIWNYKSQRQTNWQNPSDLHYRHMINTIVISLVNSCMRLKSLSLCCQKETLIRITVSLNQLIYVCKPEFHY